VDHRRAGVRRSQEPTVAALPGRSRDTPRLNRKQPASCVELVEHETKRIHIGLLSDSLAGRLFRRHVCGRAGNLADRPLAAAQRQAEIHDPDPPAAIHHDVRRLEITMQYTTVMRGG
jgi:hypothetical protein